MDCRSSQFNQNHPWPRQRLTSDNGQQSLRLKAVNVNSYGNQKLSLMNNAYYRASYPAGSAGLSNRYYVTRGYSRNDFVCFYERNYGGNDHVHIRKENNSRPKSFSSGCNQNQSSLFHSNPIPMVHSEIKYYRNQIRSQNQQQSQRQQQQQQQHYHQQQQQHHHHQQQQQQQQQHRVRSIPSAYVYRYQRQNSAKRGHLLSEIHDIFSGGDSNGVVNSQEANNVEKDSEISPLSSEASRTFQTNPQNSIILNQPPIKGILKSGSQSSYSSISNENSSDGGNPTSSNSQQSMELSSSGSNSKTSKKRVQFEEHVVSKTIVPFETHYAHSENVFPDTSEIVTINDVSIPHDVSILTDYISFASSDEECEIKPDEQNDIYEEFSKYCFPKPTSSSIRINNDVMKHDMFYKQSNKNMNGQRSEKCQGEITLPRSSTTTTNVQNGDSLSHQAIHSAVLSPVDTNLKLENNKIKVHHVTKDNLYHKNDNSQNTFQFHTTSKSDKIFGGSDEQGTSQEQEKCNPGIETYFSGRRNSFDFVSVPIQHVHIGLKKSANSHIGTDYGWSQTSTQDKNANDNPGPKIQLAPSLSPEDKKRRILDWLEGVNASGRPPSVSLLVLPRPTFRRSSFIGEC